MRWSRAAFPGDEAQWSDGRLRIPTAARQLRTRTGFPAPNARVRSTPPRKIYQSGGAPQPDGQSAADVKADSGSRCGTRLLVRPFRQPRRAASCGAAAAPTRRSGRARSPLLCRFREQAGSSRGDHDQVHVDGRKSESTRSSGVRIGRTGRAGRRSRVDAVIEISGDEYRERQARLRAAAADRGLGAVVAFSRGGGTHDRTADALWVAGLAASQPFVPDLAGHWRGAGHVAVIVATEGPCTAIVEADELQARPVVDAVVVSGDVVAAAADALVDALGGSRWARVGVLGSDVLPAMWWAVLEDAVGTRGRPAALEPADELGLSLRRRKSHAEQQLLRAAGALGSRAMTVAVEAATPGASEAQVAAAFFETVVAAGGAVYDVVISSGPASGTLGPSGGPAGAARWATRILSAGELLRLDAYGSVGGYLFDFALHCRRRDRLARAERAPRRTARVGHRRHRAATSRRAPVRDRRMLRTRARRVTARAPARGTRAHHERLLGTRTRTGLGATLDRAPTRRTPGGAGGQRASASRRRAAHPNLGPTRRAERSLMRAIARACDR
jgi:hypothetical protein